MPDSELNALQRLDQRVDEIGERVAAIEGKLDEKRKPLHKRIADYGGLIALVLSITLGAYTLYDKLWAQPARESLQLKAELRNRVRELADINARIAGIDWSDNQAATAQAQALTPQRMVEDFLSPDVYPATRSGAAAEFAMMLAQSPRTCDLEPPA